jgi:hypothetical protein
LAAKTLIINTLPLDLNVYFSDNFMAYLTMTMAMTIQVMVILLGPKIMGLPSQ